MRLLDEARDVLHKHLPGLDEELAALSLEELENPGSPGPGLFRTHGGCGLLVPAIHGGGGVSAHDAIQCARAIGSRSPSLGVATTMHHFSVASLIALAEHSEGFEWMLLDAVANDRLLVSSAFAEGMSGQGILSPTMTAVRHEKGWRINGVKKPCSLSRSMDLITASVRLPAEEGSGLELGVALVPATAPGISVHPFWNGAVLGGAESDEVRLDDVYVDDELMLRPRLDPGSHLDNLQTVGLVWFTALVTATYLGVATALVERVEAGGRGTQVDRLELSALLESAVGSLSPVADALDRGAADNGVLAKALMARVSAHHAIERVASRSVGLLGGMSFIGSPDVSRLAASATAIQFHPPSVPAVAAGVEGWLRGAALKVD